MIPQPPAGVIAMEAIVAATTTVTTLVGDVFEIITGNPLLVVFVSIGLIGSAIGLFRRFKGASRG